MLKDKVAIVTGARTRARPVDGDHLGAQGARVVICDLDGPPAKTPAPASRPRASTRTPPTLQRRLAAEVDALMQACVEHYGRLDILINNAGGSAHTPLRIEDVTEEHFDRVMDWNVRGTFLCIQRALPHLKVRGGSVVNISSIAGRSGTELVSPQYSAAKAAIVGLTATSRSTSGRTASA